ncbi:neprilysin-1-like [Diadema antillarum]|uniref:neprilysin-1-like n=1 Tax=Diadema antillarum TaxID=105358 RepID=UPI003A8357C7
MGDSKEAEYVSVSVEEPGKKAANNTNARKSSLRAQGVKCVKRRTTLEKILIFLLLIIVLLAVLLVVGLVISRRKGPNICMSKECVAAAGALIENMDLNADPCEDFYQYSCGGWKKRTTIPEERDRITVLAQLQDRLQVLSRGLLEEEGTMSDETSAEFKVKRLYRACIDEERITEQDVAPLLKFVDSVGGWPVISEDFDEDAWDLEEILARIRLSADTNFLFTQRVNRDTRNTSIYLPFIDQPMLGMKSRESFLKDKSDKVIQAYLTFMVSLATELKPDVNKTKVMRAADDAFELEKQIAMASLPKDKRRDVLQMYDKLTIQELSRLAPQFNWIKYFRLVFDDENFDGTNEVFTFDLQYMTSMASFVSRTPKSVLANFFMWRLTMKSVDHLCPRLRQHRLNFRRVVGGEEGDEPRWSTCVQRCNRLMGNALGAMFIREHFDERSKIEAEIMVHDIRAILLEILQATDWMDEDTRQLAIDKASKIVEMIGYGEHLTDVDYVDHEFEMVNITRQYHFENVVEIWKNNARDQRAQMQRPVHNNKESLETPVVANAFYLNQFNRIYFPAGIFQPPFYSRHFPKAMNYGGIGMVIGHELTHGFDDKGRNFDKDGLLREWFSEHSIEAFNKKKQCLIDQYSNFSETIEGEKVYLNGILTQGENIADNGGLKEAYLAYRRLIKRQGAEEPVLPGLGLTNNQLFFLNFGQIWCSMYRPESLKEKLTGSAHPPEHVRVIGAITNSYHFAKAYGCQVGSPMNPKNKCKLW